MNELLGRYPSLRVCEDVIEESVRRMTETFRNGGKCLLCGNGGSAADCDHIAGELLKGFRLPRTVEDQSIPEDLRRRLQGSLPAVSLHSASAAMTATLNDLDPAVVYAQMLYGLGKRGDLLLALSTSGNAENVCNAARLAKAMGITVIALTGRSGGRLAELADICICVPETETYKVQELHLPVYHFLCAKTEENLFGEKSC